MMVTAQGADHTAGNVPRMETADKSIDEIAAASHAAQVQAAAADSLGLCIFGRTVTAAELDRVTVAINAAAGSELDPSFFDELGRDTLRLEREFNRAAGFTEADDELPGFLYNEPLWPSNRVARFRAREVNELADNWWRELPGQGASSYEFCCLPDSRIHGHDEQGASFKTENPNCRDSPRQTPPG